MIKAPMLLHPSPNAAFVLDTDASLTAIGGVLSERTPDGKEHVIAYASKTLSPSQRNYCATYRELLAVVDMIKHFRHFLWGRHFEVRTDHASLTWLRNYKDSDGLIARWITRLQEYDFKVVHRPGSLHGNADGLSRCHTCKNPNCRSGAVVPLLSSSDSDPEHRVAKKAKVLAFSCDDGLSTDSNISYTASQDNYQKKLDKEVDALKWLSGYSCLLYTSPSPRDRTRSRMPSSA